MNLRTLVSARPRAAHRAAARRPALFIGVATAGALMVNILSAGEPAALVPGLHARGWAHLACVNHGQDQVPGEHRNAEWQEDPVAHLPSPPL